MADKYVHINMTMRMKDSTIQEFPDGVKAPVIGAIFHAAQKAALEHGVWIVGGMIKKPVEASHD